jgi:ring-1,2-phenylacetyl-CoA epoxidase subunit PaaE
MWLGAREPHLIARSLWPDVVAPRACRAEWGAAVTVPAVTVVRPKRCRPTFHSLAVAEVERLTEDAVAVRFDVPPDLRETFEFRAGQHLTVRRLVPGKPEVRRSYSICSTPGDLAERGVLRIGVRAVAGGAFSAYAVGGLRVGDTVEVLPPLGHFSTAFAADRARHYGAIAAGSGITPVLSLVATALSTEPASRVTLVYANRFARSVMFADELADLKDRYPSRLHLVHVLSREPQSSALLSGRLDATRLAGILSSLVDASTVDEWFLCGPYGLVLDAKEVLAGRAPGVTVHTELFHVDDGPPSAAPSRSRPARDAGEAGAATRVTMVLDGRASTFEMGPDERVLDAALRVRPELPYACKGGVCSTCRAKITEGRVEMARNFALEPDETANGYVLTCQSVPLSDSLVVDYDA